VQKSITGSIMALLNHDLLKKAISPGAGKLFNISFQVQFSALQGIGLAESDNSTIFLIHIPGDPANCSAFAGHPGRQKG